MKLTILTAYYNMESQIKNLYKTIESAGINKNDLEWLIVDDGSKSKLKIPKEWGEKINIVVVNNKVNLGKMNAINSVVQQISGEFVVEMDADWKFVSSSLKKITENFLNSDLDGVVSSNKIKGINPGDTSTYWDIKYNKNNNADFLWFVKSDIYKKYKYEVAEGERFVYELSKSLRWSIDGVQFKFLDFKILQDVTYHAEGMTSNITKYWVQNPKGFLGLVHSANKIKSKRMGNFYLIGLIYLSARLNSLKPLKVIESLKLKLIFILILPLLWFKFDKKINNFQKNNS